MKTKGLYIFFNEPQYYRTLVRKLQFFNHLTLIEHQMLRIVRKN